MRRLMVLATISMMTLSLLAAAEKASAKKTTTPSKSTAASTTPPKATAKAPPKTTAKAPPKATAKAPPKTTAKATSKTTAKATSKTAKKTPPKSAKKAAPKAVPKPLAPDTVAHPIALFLSQMCGDGKKRVTFKASAIGTRFFIEEPTGVTIYGFDGTAYRKESFVKGTTIDKVLKRYAVRAASGIS